MTIEEKEVLKRENEEKKRYLRQYLLAKRVAEEIEEEIEELRRLQIQPAIKYSEMPHGTNQRDLSDYIVQEESLINELIKARYERIVKYKEVHGKIEMLKNEEEKRILRLRYIKDMEWEEIRKRVNYSLRRIYQIHGEALKNIILD